MSSGSSGLRLYIKNRRRFSCVFFEPEVAVRHCPCHLLILHTMRLYQIPALCQFPVPDQKTPVFPLWLSAVCRGQRNCIGNFGVLLQQNGSPTLRLRGVGRFALTKNVITIGYYKSRGSRPETCRRQVVVLLYQNGRPPERKPPRRRRLAGSFATPPFGYYGFKAKRYTCPAYSMLHQKHIPHTKT